MYSCCVWVNGNLKPVMLTASVVSNLALTMEEVKSNNENKKTCKHAENSCDIVMATVVQYFSVGLEIEQLTIAFFSRQLDSGSTDLL